MANLIIGDFRSIPLQQFQARSNNIMLDYDYLIEAGADISWFETNAVAQLPLMSVSSSNIIIMLGFNDCVYSCIWETFNLEKIVANYITTINDLIKQYPSLNFYISSIPQVDADYPFAAHPDGLISAKTLNNKIKQFNTTIKSSTATYLDCCKYLDDTGFATRDGVRYISSTCDSLLSFILRSLAPNNIGSNFIPRLIAPVVNSDDIESDIYWVSTLYNGGLNPFSIPNEYTKSTGDTLPNCTAYAWGRFYEITDIKPKLSLESADTWFANTSDGYSRGLTPALGAIACWVGKASNSSHVAVVEQINSDGSITTSESALNDSRYWWLTSRDNSNNNWGEDPIKREFKGFIYCPAVTPTAIVADLDKSAVICEDRVLSQDEMEINARYIWNYLGSRGWSLNAVAGMLGNMQYESSINPGRGQVEGSGFGLVQWTPKTNLTNWTSANGYADNDIDGQLEKIINEKNTGSQYIKNTYKYTFEEFSTSLDSPYTLACAFAFDYERSWVVLYGSEAKKEILRNERGNAAETWYKVLAPYAKSRATEEQFILDNLKLKFVRPTEATASFIIKNGNNCSYTLVDGQGQICEAKALAVEPGTMQIITFNCTKKIEPATTYTLKVQANGVVGNNTLTRTIDFTTPQDPPESAKSIELTCEDNLISVDSIFNLKVVLPSSFGYWGENSGYEKILIVNNKYVKTKTTKNIKSIVTEKFNIKDEFKYNCQAGDTIQIGIRTWVVDANNKKIYDAPAPKTSEAVWLLNSPIQVYLNK